jgi:hypothetical protein
MERMLADWADVLSGKPTSLVQYEIGEKESDDERTHFKNELKKLFPK